MGLRPLACWNYGFESCQDHGYLSVVCRQVGGICDRGCTLVQRSHTGFAVPELDCEASIMRRRCRIRGCWDMEKEEKIGWWFFVCCLYHGVPLQWSGFRGYQNHPFSSMFRLNDRQLCFIYGPAHSWTLFQKDTGERRSRLGTVRKNTLSR